MWRHFVHAFLFRFRCVIAQLCYATTIFRKMRFTYRSLRQREWLLLAGQQIGQQKVNQLSLIIDVGFSVMHRVLRPERFYDLGFLGCNIQRQSVLGFACPTTMEE